MNPLSAIAGLCGMLPGWAWAIAFAMMTAAAGGEAMLKSHYKADAAAQRAAMADMKTRAAQAAQAASEAARTEEQRRADAVRKVVTDAQTQTAAARADAVRAAGAADRLRQRTAELARRSCPAVDPSTPGGGKAAAEAADLLAYVQRRVGEAQRGTVEFADSASIAGEACQGAYGGLFANRK